MIDYQIIPPKRENSIMRRTYIFFRQDDFYFIELRDNEDAIENAKCNTGTIRVEDLFGNVIWELDKSKLN